ncbi:MAG TPA: NifB/NifX family molybdenum-iron cluster-binding protein [Gaiellaceae bacterium]|jgi:predicted Fe-Mo cluster-binding NifX family protein
MSKDGVIVLAVPSSGNGGLEAKRSEHFGKCDCFTIVEIENGDIGSVRVLENPPHEHGGCLRPVKLLASSGVSALIVGGIGGRPLAGFRKAGIDIFFDKQLPTVSQAVDAVRAGAVEAIQPESVCNC